jgi:uncharacterized protein (TIGR03437 family)
MWSWFGTAALVLPVACWGQPVAVGAGYSLPGPIDVAPGQVITLYVQVPGKTVSAPVTATAPLPVTLAGFSVLLRQSFPSGPQAVPIQGVMDYQSCSPLAPSQCNVVSMVTVQIPFELTPNAPGITAPPNQARLDISYQGNAATSLILNPLTDRIHIVNGCDVILTTPAGSCAPMITHPDGTPVTLISPAQVGENLTITLVGLGVPDQGVTTGAASPQPAVPVSDVLLSVDTRTNISPGMPFADSAMAANAQLVPGAVGIYQVSFTVPVLPTATPACGGPIRSNLTVSVGRVASYDGAAICVDPGSDPIAPGEPGRRPRMAVGPGIVVK